ncbi:cholesterol transport system auxiliary component [Oxalobacteraceae bacterium GrIS 2.11]
MTTTKTVLSCLLLTAVLFLQGCASTPPTLNYYDFGALPKPAAAQCSLAPVHVADISSTSALDSNLMLYRLLYDNDQQSHAFANHRWSMTPAQLLELRIKSQLAGNQVRLIDSGVANPNGWHLRLELVDFAQYFNDATHSYAQLQLRATLLRANTVSAQTSFSQQAPATHPDAPSGAQAMRVASDALIADLTSWLCKQPPQ